MGDTQGEQQGAATLSKDLADWLLQFLSDPAALRARERPSASSTRELATAEVEAAGGARQHFPTSTSELAEAWRDSTEFSALMGCEGATPPPLALKGTYALQLYGARGHAHSFFKHLGFLLERQFKLMYRNHLYMRSRVASAAIMSIILGGLYYNRTPYQGGTFAGTFLNSLMMMGFSNMSEMAAAVENKFIAYRHASKGIFPGASYVLSSAILHVPVAVVECFVFTGIIYGMTGMHGFYLSYFFPVFLFDLVMRNLLVFFTLQAKNIQAAQAMPLPIIAVFILFGGFLVTRDKMGWLQFVSYLDPITYALRAMAINEFSSAAYSDIVPCAGSVCPAGKNTSYGAFFFKTVRHALRQVLAVWWMGFPDWLSLSHPLSAAESVFYGANRQKHRQQPVIIRHPPRGFGFFR